MMPTDVLFSSDLWLRALERYASDTNLSVMLFDAGERVVLGPVHSTPLLRMFDEKGYDPGIFAECARRCLAQTESRPAVMVSEVYGLAVVGTSLVLNGDVVGAAVGGYAFTDFSQLTEVQRLAKDAGIRFERLWEVAREQRPVPKRRLMLNGELLQVLGDALLRENFRTRQYEDAVRKLEETAEAKDQAHRELQKTASALRDSETELRSRAEELERFNRVAVGREMRMIELKKDLNDLSARHGEALLYPPQFEQEKSETHVEPAAGKTKESPPAELCRDGIVPSIVPLEAILRTEELKRRPSRLPDYETENRALTALAQVLADSPRTILQKLADTILEVFKADSAGVSLLTEDGTHFHWPAIAGAWKPHLGGGTPRNFGPCGDVLDRNAPLLFTHWERRYPYLLAATPLAEEGLLVPFYVRGKARGTIWAIAHDAGRKFDAEDLRQLESLGRFASSAYEAVEYLDMREQRRAAVNLMEDAVRSREAILELNGQLQESERRLREMIDALPTAVYTTDAEGRLTHFNPAAAEFSGRTPELGTDKWCVSWKMFKPDGTSLPHDQCPMAIALKEGRIVRGEEAILERPDGVRRWFEPYPTPLRDAQGTVVGAINMLVDITERKQAEAALREQQQRLVKVEKMAAAGQLAASMSHEINNPLSSITNLLYLLETRADLGEAARILVTTAAAELARVSRIVRQNLSYYRVGTTPRDLDLGEIVNASLRIFSESFQKAGIELEPRIGRGAALLGFPDELRQVVDNLLLNALEAMPHGGRLKISVHDSCDWKHSNPGYGVSNPRYGVRLTISDTGCGIPREHRWRIFEPFFTTKAEKGTGLGLWILRGIIAKHDGEMSMRSSDAEGRSGTVVSVFLPSNTRRRRESRISKAQSAA